MVEFELPEDLNSIVTRFGTKNNDLELTFTDLYENKTVLTPFSLNDFQKSLVKFEETVKTIIPNLIPSHYNLIENTIYYNIQKLQEDLKPVQNGNKTGNRDNKHDVRRVYLRMYEFCGKLNEAIIVNNEPKFVSYGVDGDVNDCEKIQLKDCIEVGDLKIYPIDTITSTNPIPYSFDSEEDLQKYVETAKQETVDSLYDSILEELKNYVNADNHTLTILAADIVYCYFQDKFGTTHYNIFVGEVGSGKNSALLFFRILGYRVFYITAASAANYYTFLGEIQEGQGTIAEDEADDIGKSSEKKNILKTGYASGGSVPKVGFTKNGNRFQNCYLTFCHKWLAMEELPDEKDNRGTYDRSFIHYFSKGDVKYNIKEVINDKNSELYKNLIHLRKRLFAFKLRNYDKISSFPRIKTNLKDRDAELSHILLRIFYGGRNFETVRSALSKVTHEKSSMKSSSIEAKISETLLDLITTQTLIENENNDLVEISNETFYSKFKDIVEAKDNAYDSSDSTFYLSDGTKMTKSKIKGLLRSKFKANHTRNSQHRGFIVNRKDIEKISKHYDVIDEIRILEDDKKEEEASPNTNYSLLSQPEKEMTEMTQMTPFKSVSSHSADEKSSNKDNAIQNEQLEVNKSSNENIGTANNDLQHKVIEDNDQSLKEFNKCKNGETQASGSSNDNKVSILTGDNSNVTYRDYSKLENTSKEPLHENDLTSSFEPETKSGEKETGSRPKDSTKSPSNVKSSNCQTKFVTDTKIDTPSKSVIPVISVINSNHNEKLKSPPKYPCLFCGNQYKTHIDFDMELHLVEKHKDRLLRLPISGNLDKRIEYVINQTKRKMYEESI